MTHPHAHRSSPPRKISLLVPQDLAVRLEDEAQRRGITLTKVMLEHLERGAVGSVSLLPDPNAAGDALEHLPESAPFFPRSPLNGDTLQAQLEALETRLEAGFQNRTCELVDKLSPLLARGALEAATARYLTVQILGEMLGFEAGRELARDAYDKALSHLGAPTRGVRQLLGTLEDEG